MRGTAELEFTDLPHSAGAVEVWGKGGGGCDDGLPLAHASVDVERTLVDFSIMHGMSGFRRGRRDE